MHECRRLETGVGPSIASGSHKAEIPTTDLKILANSAITASMEKLYESELKIKYDPMLAENAISATSPIRLNPIAENPDDAVSDLANHVEINKKLIIPTISQNRSKQKGEEIPPPLITAQTARRKLHNVKINFRNNLSNSK